MLSSDESSTFFYFQICMREKNYYIPTLSSSVSGSYDNTNNAMKKIDEWRTTNTSRILWYYRG